eukprot:CAMPEP_0170108980 /NCGR_PEP_ID=MMETSP0020_2-20130122/6909_1 /TAXON_ID=98059 /ORGANISM="Dinobryon sp., Strain UTEXLB2267" /LENGTH=48 /DNA_ID= /DNA_START= /DNA_END= /DNA_ORIENTATION=
MPVAPRPSSRRILFKPLSQPEEASLTVAWLLMTSLDEGMEDEIKEMNE